MTAQIADSVEFDGETYSIAGVQGCPLFEPRAHHIEPAMISTACWHGYVCWYRVRNGTLSLDRLLLGPASTVAGRELSPASTLLGSPAVKASSWPGPAWEAGALDLPVGFSGGLLLGHDLITSTLVNMGFQPAWKFAKVIELLLERGAVTRALDRSAQTAAFRQRIASSEVPDPDGPRGEAGWVNRTFSLDYSRSLPPEERKPS